MGYLQAAGAKLPQSRISAITIHRLSQKLQQPISYCCRSGVSTQGATIIEVRTDDGLTGWGDGARDAEILRANRDRVIGRSPFEVEAIFDELGGFTHDGSTAGGFDVALWDIIGKALDKPIYELLGKPYRTRVMPYASAGYRKDWPDLAEGFAEEIRHWTHDVGFRAAKMKTGYDPETDAEVIGAVRKAIGPHIRLGIDSGTPGAYDDATAVRLGKKLEECNLEFWEEPIDKYDLAGYAQLKNSLKIPLASGEALPVDWVMKNYVQGEVVDIVQPDINTTGLTGGR
ncbi:MAG: mandelate racemase/muconate lactonizing enzyme family protein, partial [Acidobacteria bacterium]|nr:mandelate racemase/muconate lactonizing enzyme family protein [Acidobacteriota bacterium]